MDFEDPVLLSEDDANEDAAEDNWKGVFDTCDSEGFGEVNIDDFARKLDLLLHDQPWPSLSPDRMSLLRSRLDSWKVCGTNNITSDSFVALMTRKRSLSFKRALHARDGQMRVGDDDPIWTTAAAGERCCSVNGALSSAPSDHCLAIDDATALITSKKNCVIVFPVLSISLVVSYYLLRGRNDWIQTLRFQAPTSLEESYEYVSYSLVHTSSMVQLAFNVAVLALLGVRLEYEHGAGRPLYLFCSGILAGSISAKIFDPLSTLQGASGGVFAILTAYLATVALKGSPSLKTHAQVVAVSCATSTELGAAIYRRYADDNRLSFAAHLAGIFIGLTTGSSVFIYSNQLKQNSMWWLSIAMQALVLLAYCFVFLTSKN